MKKSIKILKKDLKKFNSYVGNFNRILRKNGLEDLELTKTPQKFEVTVHNLYRDTNGGFREDNHPDKIQCDGFTVEMNIPEEILKVGDYQYIGCMSYVDGIWQKHFVSQECEHNDFINEKNFRCDHCHAKIGNRTGYLFFVDSNGKEIVVGRKCARSYFGYNVEEIVKCISNFDIYNYISDDCGDYDEDGFGFFSGGCGFGLRWFIPVVAFYTHDFTKWTKKECVMGETFGTSIDVKNYVFAITNSDSDMKVPNIGKFVEKYHNDETISKVTEYWKNHHTDTDFAYNCKQIIENGYVSERWIGYVTWAIFEALQNKPETEDIVIGEFVGELNQRMVLNLTITDAKQDYTDNCNGLYDDYAIDSMFLKVRLDDENGNHFQTNCHSEKMMKFYKENIGKKIAIKGTVVRQFERKNGQKVNFITRTAIYDEKKKK